MPETEVRIGNKDDNAKNKGCIIKISGSGYFSVKEADVSAPPAADKCTGRYVGITVLNGSAKNNLKLCKISVYSDVMLKHRYSSVTSSGWEESLTAADRKKMI